MKRIILLFIFIGLLGVSVYFGIDRFILPNLDKMGVHDYFIVSAIIILLVVTTIIFMTAIYKKKDEKISWLNTRLKQWTKLSVSVNQAGDEVFKELPVGIIVYDDDYKIVWVNNFAKVIFGVELLERPLVEISKELNAKIYAKNHEGTIPVANKFIEYRHSEDGKIIYLFDVTYREQLSIKYYNRTPVVGIITMDNLEMETKQFDLQDIARIRSEFISEIANWANRFKAFLKSDDDDALFFTADREALDAMIADKFSLLQNVRDISSKNNIRVTLSIGIASYDTNSEELGSIAQNAIDLAERRGGDQVVVNIEGEKIQYFGASLNAIEKNTLSAARANATAIRSLIEEASSVYIMGHIFSDSDSLGAMIGALKLALASTRKVHVVLDIEKIDQTAKKIYDIIEEQDSEILNYFISSRDINDVETDALLIVVDTQSPKIVMSEEVFNKFSKVALIDHHRSGEIGYENLAYSYVETSASSTVEMITEMFQFYQKNTIQVSSIEATIMLAGLVVDTNNFTYRCGFRTFEAAAMLREFGADMVEIRRILRNDLEFQNMLSQYATRSEIILNQFAVCTFDEDDIVTDRPTLAKVAEYLLNIDDIEASFVIANCLVNGENEVAISARSLKDVNVQILMEELGGGGHLNSAAAQIKDKSMSEVKDEIINILKRDFELGDEKMKLILIEDVKGKGKKNQVVEVATGYGNYLVTNKKAILATDENLAALKAQIEQEQIEALNQKKMMQKIKEDIEDKSINIYIKVGADGKLYGRVTTKEICEELEAQAGIHIDKRKVSLPTDITALGVYTANIDLHKDVQATLEINVLEK